MTVPQADWDLRTAEWLLSGSIELLVRKPFQQAEIMKTLRAVMAETENNKIQNTVYLLTLYATSLINMVRNLFPHVYKQTNSNLIFPIILQICMHKFYGIFNSSS